MGHYWELESLYSWSQARDVGDTDQSWSAHVLQQCIQLLVPESTRGLPCHLERVHWTVWRFLSKHSLKNWRRPSSARCSALSLASTVTSLLRSLLFLCLVYLCKKSVLLLLYNPKLSFFHHNHCSCPLTGNLVSSTKFMVSSISTMADRMSSAGYQLGRGLLVYTDSIIIYY